MFMWKFVGWISLWGMYVCVGGDCDFSDENFVQSSWLLAHEFKLHVVNLDNNYMIVSFEHDNEGSCDFLFSWLLKYNR